MRSQEKRRQRPYGIIATGEGRVLFRAAQVCLSGSLVVLGGRAFSQAPSHLHSRPSWSPLSVLHNASYLATQLLNQGRLGRPALPDGDELARRAVRRPLCIHLTLLTIDSPTSPRSYSVRGSSVALSSPHGPGHRPQISPRGVSFIV